MFIFLCNIGERVGDIRDIIFCMTGPDGLGCDTIFQRLPGKISEHYRFKMAVSPGFSEVSDQPGLKVITFVVVQTGE